MLKSDELIAALQDLKNMKYCPICDERYDEEIIRFCTKDGTPLIEVEEPNFTALPSENVEDGDELGEETVIRSKSAHGEPFGSRGQSERIVIPTEPESVEPVRPRTVPAYYPPPPQPNTLKTVVLTILGTLAVLGFGAILFWLLQKDTPTNVNVNFNANLANQNANLNANVGFDSNFNFNSNANFNTNLNTNFNFNGNFNANIKMPSPSPTPKPSPSPTSSPISTPAPSSSPTPRPSATVGQPDANARLTPPGTPRTGPRPPPLAGNRPPANTN